MYRDALVKVGYFRIAVSYFLKARDEIITTRSTPLNLHPETVANAVSQSDDAFTIRMIRPIYAA